MYCIVKGSMPPSDGGSGYDGFCMLNCLLFDCQLVADLWGVLGVVWMTDYGHLCFVNISMLHVYYDFRCG